MMISESNPPEIRKHTSSLAPLPHPGFTRGVCSQTVGEPRVSRMMRFDMS